MFNILHDIEINTTKDKVFEYISNPFHLNNWWTKSSEGKADLGERYRFYFTPEYDWFAEVSKINSPEQIEFKMTKSDEDWDPTSFGFHLSDTINGTLLSFYHNNWQSQNHHYRRTNCCWALLLKGLKDYCEQEIIVPFEKRA